MPSHFRYLVRSIMHISCIESWTERNFVSWRLLHLTAYILKTIKMFKLKNRSISVALIDNNFWSELKGQTHHSPIPFPNLFMFIARHNRIVSVVLFMPNIIASISQPIGVREWDAHCVSYPWRTCDLHAIENSMVF